MIADDWFDGGSANILRRGSSSIPPVIPERSTGTVFREFRSRVLSKFSRCLLTDKSTFGQTPLSAVRNAKLLQSCPLLVKLHQCCGLDTSLTWRISAAFLHFFPCSAQSCQLTLGGRRDASERVYMHSGPRRMRGTV